MKILGGQFRRRNIYMPPGIRPTQNIARKSIFDTLGQDLEGLKFLDLFAGSGAIGLEAISRGCAQVTFVENNLHCCGVIKENLGLLGLSASASEAYYHALNLDAFAAIEFLFGQHKIFDIIFIDPPYVGELAKKALKTLSAYDILTANSWVVVQHVNKENLPSKEGNLEIFRQKAFSKTLLSFYQRKF